MNFTTHICARSSVIGVRSLYTDTDSLMYSVECEDVYKRMKRDIDRFDTSDYAVDNPYGMPRVNKKVPVLMKDENNGALMTEFVGLRSKMDATRTFNAVLGSKSETKKVKDVRRHVVANNIQFDDYIRCLRDLTEKSIQQNNIRPKEHNVYSVSGEKNALSPFDDKRCILVDRVSTRDVRFTSKDRFFESFLNRITRIDSVKNRNERIDFARIDLKIGKIIYIYIYTHTKYNFWYVYLVHTRTRARARTTHIWGFGIPAITQCHNTLN